MNQKKSLKFFDKCFENNTIVVIFFPSNFVFFLELLDAVVVKRKKYNLIYNKMKLCLTT